MGVPPSCVLASASGNGGIRSGSTIASTNLVQVAGVRLHARRHTPIVHAERHTRIGDRGTPVGPDLSTIGKLRPREDLLESLLDPSRRIEPKYATYSVARADGVSLTGLLVGRDESRVVLRDGQGKEVIVAAKNVEELRPSRASLMPDGQLADLTAQEAADLVAYLASLR